MTGPSVGISTWNSGIGSPCSWHSRAKITSRTLSGGRPSNSHVSSASRRAPRPFRPWRPRSSSSRHSRSMVVSRSMTARSMAHATWRRGTTSPRSANVRSMVVTGTPSIRRTWPGARSSDRCSMTPSSLGRLARGTVRSIRSVSRSRAEAVEAGRGAVRDGDIGPCREDGPEHPPVRRTAWPPTRREIPRCSGSRTPHLRSRRTTCSGMPRSPATAWGTSPGGRGR